MELAIRGIRADRLIRDTALQNSRECWCSVGRQSPLRQTPQREPRDRDWHVQIMMPLCRPVRVTSAKSFAYHDATRVRRDSIP